MPRWLARLGGWCIGLSMLAWRLTCRYRVEADPRPELRASDRPYAYALLHAHQIAAVFCNDERRMAAMVSRSQDGDLLVPSLRLRRVEPVRGSSRRKGRDKGGSAALAAMKELARARVPVLFAVDGPRGPRNRVQRGVAALAQEASAVVLPTVALSSRRWILTGTWDRMQLPRPFCTVRLIFGQPIEPADFGSDEEAREQLRATVEARLSALERAHDPREASHARHDA